MNIWIFLFMLLVSQDALAETIMLKSGKVIDGKIVQRNEDEIKVDIGVGVNITYFLDDIESIDGKEIPSVVETKEIPLINENNQPPRATANIKELSSGEIPTEDGLYKVSMPSNMLKEGHSGWVERTYKDGKLNGLEKTYVDGKLISEGNYKNNQLDGLTKEYYENGNVATETYFKEGKVDGLAKAYYKNGTLKMQANNAMDKPVGDMTVYFESGKTQQIITFDDNGNPLSKKEYNENGDLIKELDQQGLFKEMNERIKQ